MPVTAVWLVKGDCYALRNTDWELSEVLASLASEVFGVSDDSADDDLPVDEKKDDRQRKVRASLLTVSFSLLPSHFHIFSPCFKQVLPPDSAI